VTDELVAVQHRYPPDPTEDVPRILDLAARAVDEGGIAVLPEYFFKPADERLQRDEVNRFAFVEDAVVDASTQTSGALVATVPDVREGKLFNTAIVAQDGDIVLRQPKLVPTPPEAEAGVSPGQTLNTARVQGVDVGVLVCADALSLRLVSALQDEGVDVLAVPVLSPPREGTDPTRSARTSVFVGRAWDLGAYVVKAGGFEPGQAAGRSLIAAPWGLVDQAAEEQAATRVDCELEPKRLREAREPFDPLRRSRGRDPE